jgi:hypothetical protein
VTPAELQTVHRFVLDTAAIEAVSDEVRAVVESVWPELIVSGNRALHFAGIAHIDRAYLNAERS